MKANNKVTLEELDNKKIKQKEKINYFDFFKKKILPQFFVCLVITIIITLITTISAVDYIKTLGCNEIYCDSQEITISENFINRLEVIILTVIAGVVPYFYLPYLGLISYMYNEIITVGHIINVNGYAIGIFKYLLPFTLNIIAISIVTSLAIYLVKQFTIKFIISRSNTMNFTNFRLKVYEMLKKQDKYTKLIEKKNTRLEKMQKKAEKIEWKGLIITLISVIIIQFVAVVLQSILI